MIIYLHVAKCGGTTMLHYLERQCKTFHLKAWWRSDWVIPGGTECLFSHCPYGEPDKQSRDPRWALRLPSKHQYVTFLRDPVDRIISNYFFIRAHPNHPGHRVYTEHYLEDIIQTNVHSTLDNGIVRLISGRQDIGVLPPITEVTRDDLERAKENIATFAMVGFVETYDEDLARFADLFGWKSLAYTRHRTGQRPPKSAVPSRIIEIIKEYTKFDQELVDFAKEM